MVLVWLVMVLGLGMDGGRARFRAAFSYDEGKCLWWVLMFVRKVLVECGVDFEVVGVDCEMDVCEGGLGG